jgi:hypothetical protein
MARCALGERVCQTEEPHAAEQRDDEKSDQPNEHSPAKRTASGRRRPIATVDDCLEDHASR